MIMRMLLHVSAETMAALINLASLAFALGTAAAIYSQSIQSGLLVTAGAFISGVLAFGYSVWKLRRTSALT
jgi:hypothetical protein